MELISREDLLKQIEIDSNGNRGQYGDEWFFIDTIKSMPTVELERTGNTVTMTSKKYIELIEKAERKGHWIGIEDDGYADGNPVYHLWECSVCEFEVDAESSYCPCCGAQMVEKEE